MLYFLIIQAILHLSISSPETRRIVHIGEDGTAVYASTARILGHAEVDEELLEEKNRQEQLDVLILLSFQPGDKISRSRASIEKETRREIADSQIQLIQKIVSLGGNIRNRFHSLNALSATIPSEALDDLSSLEEIASIHKDHSSSFDLHVSAQSIFAPSFWDAGITGSSFDLGLVDGPVDITHPRLSSHNIIIQPGTPLPAELPAPVNYHGTYVAGIMASTHSQYKGIAFGCDKIYSGFGGTITGGNGDEGAALAAFDWILSQEDAAEVINLSKSYGVANTDDNAITRFCDAIVSQKMTTIVKSAGNNSCGNTTIGYPGNAWNVLVVGAMDDRGTATRSDDRIADFSSSGPTASGRKKPDLCAPGFNITSLTINGGITSLSGTSAAAPHVSGAVLLLYEEGHHSPLSVRATLINTADSWDNTNDCITANDFQASAPGWNKSYGWGYLNLANARAHANDYFLGELSPRGKAGDFKLYRGFMQNGDKITMTWNRRVGYNGAVYPNAWYSLSDLNLALYNENNNQLLAEDLDPDDNVHQASPTIAQEVVVRCYSWSDYFDGDADSEEFALATGTGFVESAGPRLSIQLFQQEIPSLQNFRRFLVIGLIRNLGDLSAHENLLSLNLPSGTSLLSGSSAQNLGVLLPGDLRATNWIIQSPRTRRPLRIQAINHSLSYGVAFQGRGEITLH